MGLEVHLEPIFGQLRLSGPIWAQLCRCGSSCFTFMPRILCTSGSVSLISTPIHGRLCGRNGAQNSPEKQATRDAKSTKVVNRVVPAYRRAKVRGAVLQDTEDEHK
ncbi:hypothetical protein M0R45_020207 [Rubus argutus]|uniref:Uncharacterized protein n=1 Tax=Rubus argutus TaxID=59490 RepID=A0AAW1X8I5_RUBAR